MSSDQIGIKPHNPEAANTAEIHSTLSKFRARKCSGDRLRRALTSDSAAGGLQWMVVPRSSNRGAEIMVCSGLISIQAMTSWRQRPARDLDLGAVGWLARSSAAAADDSASNR